MPDECERYESPVCRGIVATRWVGGWCSLDGEQAQVVDDAEKVARRRPPLVAEIQVVRDASTIGENGMLSHAHRCPHRVLRPEWRCHAQLPYSRPGHEGVSPFRQKKKESLVRARDGDAPQRLRYLPRP